MTAKQIERAAYIAAHRILSADLSAPELACPGARRSATVDRVAQIISDVFAAQPRTSRPAQSKPEPRVLPLAKRPKIC